MRTHTVATSAPNPWENMSAQNSNWNVLFCLFFSFHFIFSLLRLLLLIWNANNSALMLKYIHNNTPIVNWAREIKNPSDSKWWRQKKNLLISTITTGEEKLRLLRAVRFIFSDSKGCYKTKKHTMQCAQLNAIEWEGGKCCRPLEAHIVWSMYDTQIHFNWFTFYQIEHCQQCSEEFGVFGFSFSFKRLIHFRCGATKKKIETTTKLLIRCN